jgi:hypothetical protein
VYEFQFDLEFLLTNPTAFTVNLPRVTAPILLRYRPDLNNLLSSVTASAGGNTPVPGQPSVINSAAVNLKSARLWTGQVGIANAGLSAVSVSASTDTWNIYGEIRYLENRTNRWRFFKVRAAGSVGFGELLLMFIAAAAADSSLSCWKLSNRQQILKKMLKTSTARAPNALEQL